MSPAARHQSDNLRGLFTHGAALFFAYDPLLKQGLNNFRLIREIGTPNLFAQRSKRFQCCSGWLREGSQR